MIWKEKVQVIKSQLLYRGEAKLGEGAWWNSKTQKLWWIDIEQGLFHIYDPQTQTNQTYPVHQRIGTVVPDTDGNAIVALQDGIYRLFLHDGSLELLVKAMHDPEKIRFNDGKCDPAGRLWVGTMALDHSKGKAALFRFDPDLKLKKVLDGVSISNGIVWSADLKKMYYIDTPTRQVKEFEYDVETGEIEYSRVAVEIPKNMGFPDGMSIDVYDRLWIGHFEGQSVNCWDPQNGNLITSIEVEAKNVTSCDFGGRDRDKLFITTASTGMTEEEKAGLPLSGNLFVADVDVQGRGFYFFGE